jgi:hypothetical protein
VQGCLGIGNWGLGVVGDLYRRRGQQRRKKLLVMQQVNKVGLKIFIASFAVIITMLVIRKMQEERISTNGVYQIAIVNTKDYAKNGTRYNFTYHYKGIEYRGALLSSGIDSFFVIKLLPNKPKTWIFIQGDLPSCLPKTSFSDIGWKELPNCK